MAKSRFKITKFKNPSGAQVYRLSGTLNGKRIRENYKSKEDAVAKRQEYDIEHLNGQSDGQTVWTTLTQDQNRDAIAAVNVLKRTDGGSDMSHYDDLIQKCLRSITGTFTDRTAQTLFSGRDGKLPCADEIPSELETEYELLTWLVILDFDASS